MPVPMAVPPMLISHIRCADSRRRFSSSAIMAAKAANSWPRVMGTASCNWVRPIFRMGANSCALASKAPRSAASACSRVWMPKYVAIFTAVG